MSSLLVEHARKTSAYLDGRDQGLRLLILVAIVMAIVAYDSHYLLRYPVAVGLDGYYYVLQLSDLRNDHSLFFPSSTPLLFYLLFALDLAFNNPVLTIKIASIALQVLLCLGLFFNIFVLTRSLWLGVLSCVLATVPQLHFFFVGEFLKNLLAVVLLVWAGFCLQQLRETHKRGWAVLGLVLLTAAFFSHKSAIGIAGLLAVTFVLLRLSLSPIRGARIQLCALVALALIWLLPLIIKLQPFMRLPPTALAEITGGNRWRSPVLIETLLLLALTLASLYLLVSFRERLPEKAILPLGLVAISTALVTVNPLLNPLRDWDSIFGRLRGLAYIQIAILFPILLWVVERLSRKLFVLGLVALPVLVVSTYGGPPPTMSAAYLSRRNQIAHNLPGVREHLCADPIVIATHGDQFLVTSILGIASQKEWPAENKHQCMYWLLNMARVETLPASKFIVAEEEMNSYSDQPRGQESGRLYSVIVKHEDLGSTINLLTSGQKRSLLSFNPHLSRYLAGAVN